MIVVGLGWYLFDWLGPECLSTALGESERLLLG